MGFHSVLKFFSCLGFYVLILMALETHLSYGSSVVPPSLTRGIVVDPSTVGICASSVTIYGYQCQEIEVETQDGYILSVQRIAQGHVRGNDVKRPPVLVQHGVLVDGMTWLLNPPDQNLPLILADQGLDVWIANSRGTKFSRKHSSLLPNQPEFWDWSWDELVSFDLPAVFDYVYSQTGQKIHYVGHSLGTLIALASLAERVIEVDKVKSVALLSPIAYLSHMNTALGVVAAKAFVGEIAKLFGVAEFNPTGEPVARLLKSLCDKPGVDCYDYLTALTGKNCCLNSSTVDLFLRNEPQSTATKNMVHLAQTVRDGVIAKYNYGNAEMNFMHYGETKPPVYNLSNIPIHLPIFMSYGGQDALSDVRDVAHLLDCLVQHCRHGGCVHKLTVQFVADYAHADFIMGANANELVYNHVVSFFKHHL